MIFDVGKAEMVYKFLIQLKREKKEKISIFTKYVKKVNLLTGIRQFIEPPFSIWS